MASHINGHPISLNTFVYCENNPVNMVDQYGYFALPWEIKVGLAASVASAIWEAVSFIYSNPGLNILSWTFMKGLGGAITLGFARGFLLGVITCISRSWQFGAIGGTISLLYEITVNSSQGKSTSINQGVSAFMNGWSAAVYSRTVSNVLGNVSRVLRWSTRKTDIIEFIFDTLLGLGITNYLKW